MQQPADSYESVAESVIGDAGCVTVVPAASEKSVLAAFGAMSSTGRPSTLADLPSDTGTGGPIYVARVDEALIVVENNGFQGSRPEVLRPASKASGSKVAASFFWNVNGLTAFSGAKRGKALFSVELLDVSDEDLDGIPRALRKRVLAAGSDDGDVVPAGLALVAAFTDTPLPVELAVGGTVYEIEPPTAELQSYGPDYEYTYDMPDAARRLVRLTEEQQRAFARWAVVAAVRESGLDNHPVLAGLLAPLGSERGASGSPAALEQLARVTMKKHAHFRDLFDDLEAGGYGEWPVHPYYEVSVPGRFEEHKAISEVEGFYLSQQANAVQAVRYLNHPEPLSAAIGCLDRASATYVNGRTDRGWTFTENERGRFRTGHQPNPRHQQFIHVASTLMTDLATFEPTGEAIATADVALPTPLTATQRTDAIHADALADANGAYSTYQVWRRTD